jgi:homoserine dehydrogenase
VRDIQVGLIGLGTVGSGVARILLNRGELIRKKLGVRLNLKRVVDLDLSRAEGLNLPPGVLSDDVHAILNDPEIDVMVELIGGQEPAGVFILKALEAGEARGHRQQGPAGRAGKTAFRSRDPDREESAF